MEAYSEDGYAVFSSPEASVLDLRQNQVVSFTCQYKSLVDEEEGSVEFLLEPKTETLTLPAPWEGKRGATVVARMMQLSIINGNAVEPIGVMPFWRLQAGRRPGIDRRYFPADVSSTIKAALNNVIESGSLLVRVPIIGGSAPDDRME